ncbi:Crp/Fnr family transcriptional regulator [Aquamicrobium segne]|uniref:Crp/Fnr family transcriptional regulator n=1 Tax=Aquamicrobium segne TaxID=469547 RepID=A0ABW0GX44_9HYPH
MSAIPDEVPKLCEACESRHKGMCGALQVEQLAILARIAHKREAKSGAELLAEAEQADVYANVLSGVVKLTKTLSDGRQQIVGLQFAPDFLGRPFRKESHLNAEAATDVVLCTFPTAALERMIQETPELERQLYRQVLNDLDEARDWMVTLGRKTASEKVASFLLLIARNIDPDSDAECASITFDLPLTRADIADFLGLTIETVSRQLTRLRTDKIISIKNNRCITVPNLERLATRAGN